MMRHFTWLITLLILILAPQSGAAPRFVDIIVELDPAFTSRTYPGNREKAAAIARNLGITPRYTYGAALFGFAGRIPQGRLNGLAHDPRVVNLSLDQEVSLPRPRVSAPQKCLIDPSQPGCKDSQSDEDNSGQATPWGIARIGADYSTFTGRDIHVYVIDTGIDSNHSDLEARLGNGYAVFACNGKRKDCKYLWDDDHGHGTHVAGTIGASDNSTDVVGVAPEVTLHAVKVLTKSGSGSISSIIQGVDWVTNEVSSLEAPAVANMSIGTAGAKNGTCSDSDFTGFDSFHRALCTAKNAGVVFSVAAGNSGANALNTIPAAYDDAVITVSATTDADDWPSWSNWGSQPVDWTDNDSAPLAIAAPGVGVLSTRMGGGTTLMNGTSMAAPHVAGAVALLLQSTHHSADASAFSMVRDQLLLSAEETEPGFSNTSGHLHAEDFLQVQ